MKITKMLLVMFLAVAAVSCNKDDDGPEPFQYNAENLRGTYELNYLQFTEVITRTVDGFEVVTTTTGIGDTFDVTAVFAANSTVTTNGSYRVVETSVQGNNTTTDSYIEIINNETVGYSVNASTSRLTIEGQTFEVSNFSQSGFTLISNDVFTEPNGDTFSLTAEQRFVKQ